MKQGDKIYFEEEKRPYSIRAISKNYAICTKPFPPQKTVIYTIIDFNKNIRGTNNYVFNPYDYLLDEDCNESLKDLEEGFAWRSKSNEEITYIDGADIGRNNIPLKIKKVVAL